MNYRLRSLRRGRHWLTARRYWLLYRATQHINIAFITAPYTHTTNQATFTFCWRHSWPWKKTFRSAGVCSLPSHPFYSTPALLPELPPAFHTPYQPLVPTMPSDRTPSLQTAFACACSALHAPYTPTHIHSLPPATTGMPMGLAFPSPLPFWLCILYL